MSKYRIFIFITITILLSVLFFLYQIKETNKTLRHNGGFSRNYIENQYKFVDIKKITNDYLVQSGFRDLNKQYLYSTITKQIFLLDLESDEIQVNEVILPDEFKIGGGYYYFLKDTLYIIDNKHYNIYKYHNTNNNLFTKIPFERQILQPHILENGNIVCKSFIPENSNFGIYQIDNHGTRAKNETLFFEGADLANDGFIQPFRDGFFYVTMYRNIIKVLDIDFNVRNVHTTIDTISSSVGVVRLNNGAVTFKTQPPYVNRATFVKDGRLLIYSGVFADNDRGVSSYTTFILDAYNIENDMAYEYSIKIPLPKGLSTIPGSFFIGDGFLLIYMLDGNIIKYKQS